MLIFFCPLPGKMGHQFSKKNPGNQPIRKTDTIPDPLLYCLAPQPRKQKTRTPNPPCWH